MKKEIKKKLAKAATLTTEIVLEAVLGLAESLLVIAAGRREVYRQLYNPQRNLTYRDLCCFLDSLRRRKYIEVIPDPQNSIVFTNKAKLKIADKIAGKKGWDGKYRLVSFDIPEQWRSRRNNFRRAIKRLGFKQIQKSLWVCDRNVEELVDLASEEYKVREYVACFIVEISDIDSIIGKILDK